MSDDNEMTDAEVEEVTQKPWTGLLTDDVVLPAVRQELEGTGLRTVVLMVPDDLDLGDDVMLLQHAAHIAAGAQRSGQDLGWNAAVLALGELEAAGLVKRS